MNRYAVIFMVKYVVDADNESKAKLYAKELLLGGRSKIEIMRELEIYTDLVNPMDSKLTEY